MTDLLSRTTNAGTGDRMNGHAPAEPPLSGPIFQPAAVQMQRRMRFNPLRTLTPENLSTALDQFDIGILRQAALLWDAMARRDDTLSFVSPQLQIAIAGKPWGVFKKKNADEAEAARHAAALEYFYGNVTATDAFDRNVRGDRNLLLKQMAASYGMKYAVHHFVWRPEPGKMIEVEGAAPVPALTAELEAVPLWFFENISGRLRFLPFGGFGIDGQELNWDGEWMVTTGPGMMFAASICYTFKRLTFQDWTIFNERYAQQKPVGQTPEGPESPQGQAMASIVADFNSDQGIVLYGSTPGDKLPISLLGPEGTVSVDLFERFLDRQDRKMSVMFRGSDLRNMSREKETTGVSAQSDETESLEMALCMDIASAARAGIDRAVIRYCFGEGVEPLAYFGLPDMDKEDAQQLRESAGFLADRGLLVEGDTVAERLGVTLTEDPARALTGNRREEHEEEEDPKAKRLRELVATANANSRHDERGRFASGGIAALVEQSLSGGGERQLWHNYASVSPEEAARLKKSTGLDVEGYEHRIESSAIRKVIADHGGDPLPVTREDFEKIPGIVAAPDSVSLSSQSTKQGLQAIQYSKRFNGTTIVVEEVRTGQRKLALKTLYKRKAGPSA